MCGQLLLPWIRSTLEGVSGLGCGTEFLLGTSKSLVTFIFLSGQRFEERQGSSEFLLTQHNGTEENAVQISPDCTRRGEGLIDILLAGKAK